MQIRGERGFSSANIKYVQPVTFARLFNFKDLPRKGRNKMFPCVYALRVKETYYPCVYVKETD